MSLSCGIEATEGGRLLLLCSRAALVALWHARTPAGSLQQDPYSLSAVWCSSATGPRTAWSPVTTSCRSCFRLAAGGGVLSWCRAALLSGAQVWPGPTHYPSFLAVNRTWKWWKQQLQHMWDQARAGGYHLCWTAGPTAEQTTVLLHHHPCALALHGAAGMADMCTICCKGCWLISNLHHIPAEAAHQTSHRPRQCLDLSLPLPICCWLLG